MLPDEESLSLNESLLSWCFVPVQPQAHLVHQWYFLLSCPVGDMDQGVGLLHVFLAVCLSCLE